MGDQDTKKDSKLAYAQNHFSSSLGLKDVSLLFFYVILFLLDDKKKEVIIMRLISIPLLILLFLFCPSIFSQETITLTTYYPAPFGVYSQLVTLTLGVGNNDGVAGIGGSDAPNPNTNPGDVWINGNLGIGTGVNGPQAILDLNSTTSGFLPPRMSTADRDGMLLPLEGMIIYNIDEDRAEIFVNSAWRAMGGGTPSGAVLFFDLDACPSGWSAFAAARGRFLLGLPSGGTLRGTVGTRLSNLEDRGSTLNHTHTLTTGPKGSVETICGYSAYSNCSRYFRPQTGTGVAVGGTNAPYIQLLACRKD